jgi:hypothetical protein
VLTTPIKISQSLLMRYKEAVGDMHCEDKHEGEGSEEKGKKDSMPFATNGTYFTLPPSSKSE